MIQACPGRPHDSTAPTGWWSAILLDPQMRILSPLLPLWAVLWFNLDIPTPASTFTQRNVLSCLCAVNTRPCTLKANLHQSVGYKVLTSVIASHLQTPPLYIIQCATQHNARGRYNAFSAFCVQSLGMMNCPARMWIFVFLLFLLKFHFRICSCWELCISFKDC